MDSAIWIAIYLPLLLMLYVIFMEHKSGKQWQVFKRIKARRERGGSTMSESIQRFVGKECIITTMSANIVGMIESVEGNWVVLASTEGKAGGSEIISVDYISRIREYPRRKSGKKKMIVT